MSNVKKSLTRKIGPLPVWAWTIVVFAGVWYYRNKLSAAAQTDSGTGTGSVGPAPPTPGDPMVLQPGESVYDPGTGLISTAPGGDGSGGSGGGSGAGTGGGGGTTNGGGGGSTTPPPNRTSPRKHPHYTRGGNIYIGGYSRRPPRRKGYTLRGIGGGWWEYVKNKRNPTKKHQHGKPPKTTKHNKPGHKSRHRSPSAIRNANGGRINVPRATSPIYVRRVRGGVKSHASQPRTSSNARLTHGVVSGATVRQRPVATATPRTSQRHSAQPSVHRAPPTRTIRTTSTHRGRRKK